MTDTQSPQTASNMPGEFVHKGLIFPCQASREFVENSSTFDVHPEDIFVTGYPKTGCNWVKAITCAILNADKLDTLGSNVTENTLPLPFEFFTPDHVSSKISRPAVFYSHFTPSLMPEALKKKKGKVIHVMRNPRDVAVSSYHFHQNNEALGCYKGSWEDFFQCFNAGRVTYGSWYKYYEEWINNSGDMNVKFLQYEDLIADPPASISSLAEFLEKPLTEEQLDSVVRKTSFVQMGGDPVLQKIRPDVPNFMRKGKVGDWKNYFSEEQMQVTDVRYQELKSRTGLTFRFE